MVRINGLDKCTHLINPCRDRVGCASGAARKITDRICTAARLIRKLPGEDARGIGIPLDNLTNVVLVSGLDLGISVELQVDD